MVLDTLQNWQRYTALHPAFTRGFEYLVRGDWSGAVAAKGDSDKVRDALDGERLYVSIERVHGRGRDRARLEAHRRYIDIQLTIEGDEEIGWKPLAGCAEPDGQFDAARDVGFFTDRPESWLSLPAGHFAIFFPADAHAPLAATGMLVKAIMKIAVE